MITNKDLTEITCNYQRSPSQDRNYNTLKDALDKLADHTMRYMEGLLMFPDMPQHTKDLWIEEMSLCALQKAHAFKSKHGCKAFNFYTTIMLGVLWQLYRNNKHPKDKVKCVNER